MFSRSKFVSSKVVSSVSSGFNLCSLKTLQFEKINKQYNCFHDWRSESQLFQIKNFNMILIFLLKNLKFERVHRILTNFFTFSKLKCSSYIPIRKYICCVLQYLLYWYNSVMYFNIFCTGTILWCTAVSPLLAQLNSVLLYLLYW